MANETSSDLTPGLVVEKDGPVLRLLIDRPERRNGGTAVPAPLSMPWPISSMAPAEMSRRRLVGSAAKLQCHWLKIAKCQRPSSIASAFAPVIMRCAPKILIVRPSVALEEG
jgi:hypothetical protein